MSTDPSLHIDIRRSNLGRARGLGSAKNGLHHWWAQRVTAIFLLPLALYFVLTVLMLDHDTRLQVVAFMAEPWNAVLYLCLVVALFYHLSLGVQVVLEDYVHSEGLRLLSIMLVNAACAFLARACAVSILKLAL